MSGMLQDLRYAVRTLRNSPGFTAVAVLTLALGIGANTAIFSIVNTVLLEPLRIPQPDRVVVFMNSGLFKQPVPTTADIEFNLLRKQGSVLEEASAYRPNTLYLTGVDQPQKVDALLVTEDYFRLFGLPVTQGRGFTAEEERGTGMLYENGHVVVLSDAFWKRSFGGDPHILGKTISLSGDPYTVVGIMAPGIRVEASELPDVWLPFPMSPNSNTQVHYFQTVARLKPGVTVEMANAQLQLMTSEFRRAYPNTVSAKRGDTYRVQILRDAIVKDARLSLAALSAAVSFVLLIACANVANLVVARVAGRTREMAIRAALGATRGKIIRQVLTESMLLSAVAALFGLGIGLGGVHFLLSLMPSSLPRIGVHGSNIGADWRLFLFIALTASLTALFFGLIPAIQASGADPNDGLKQTGECSGGFRRNRLRSVLVVSETSLALLSLIVAVLFIRTLVALRSVDPGFDARNVVTTRTPLDPKLLISPDVNQTVQQAFQRLGDLPGVERAALTTLLPLDGYYSSLPIAIAGRPLDGPYHGFARPMTVSPGYFDVLKIPLLRGRFFTDADRLDAPGVVVINQAMARQLWPDSDPLSDRLIIGTGLGPRIEQPARQVIGIVGDVRDNGLDAEPQPTVFVPGAQNPNVRWSGVTVAWVVRTRGRSASINLAIQDVLRQTTGLPVPPLRSMDEVIAQSTAPQRFNMLLMAIFGGAALLLATIGIYGVMAYLVVQRTHEIGIRMALGAHHGDVLKMILSSGAKLTLTGIGIGIAGGLLLARLLSSMLFGVRPTDPLTFTAVSLGLFGVALLACYIPARRAMRVDPVVALRHE